ncbi:MAG: NPCBM/NEW2 domain-containing protein [Planctomycetota bacterium]
MAAPTAFSQSLHTPSGTELDAPSIERSEKGWSKLAADGKTNPTEIIRWGSYQGVLNQSAAWLSDGSWLCGDLKLLDDKLVVNNAWFLDVQIPLTSLRGLVIQPKSSQRAWLKLQFWMESATGSDDLVRHKDGKTHAGLIELMNQEDPSAVLVELAKGGTKTTWSSEDVHAIVFSPALTGSVPRDRQGTTLAFSDGSLLHAKRLEVVQGRLSVTTDAGLLLTSIDSAQRISKELQFVHRNSDVKYLSDMPIAQYKYLPGSSSLRWELGVDEDCLGRPLLVDGGVVPKGLAMHASSQVAFRWNGAPAVFRSELRFAKPPNGGSSQLGNARCQLLVARNGKLESAVEVILDRNHKAAAAVEIDVQDAQLIVLVTEEHQKGQFGDHVLWLDARLDEKDTRQENLPKKK